MRCLHGISRTKRCTARAAPRYGWGRGRPCAEPGRGARTVVMRSPRVRKPFSWQTRKRPSKTPGLRPHRNTKGMRRREKADVFVFVTPPGERASGHRVCHSHSQSRPPQSCTMRSKVSTARCIEEALEVVRWEASVVGNCREVVGYPRVRNRDGRARYSGDGPRNRQYEIAVKGKTRKGCRAPSPRGGPSPRQDSASAHTGIKGTPPRKRVKARRRMAARQGLQAT